MTMKNSDAYVIPNWSLNHKQNYVNSNSGSLFSFGIASRLYNLYHKALIGPKCLLEPLAERVNIDSTL